MRFANSALITFVSNLFVGLASLLLAVLLSRELGAEGKGIVAFLFVVPSLIALLADGGISIGTIYSVRKESRLKDPLFGNSLIWSVVIGSIAFLIAVWFNDAFVKPHGGWSDGSIVYFSAALAPLLLFIALQRNLLLGCNEIKKYNINSLLQPIFVLIICLVLFYFYQKSTVVAIWSYFSAVLLVVIFLINDISIKKFVFDFKLLKDNIKFGFTGHLGTIIQYFNYRLDVVILGFITGPVEVGVYSVSYTCAEILWRFPRAIGTILFPKISGMNKEDSDNLTRVVFKITNIILIIMTGFGAFIGYYFIPTIFGDEFVDAVMPFLILMPGVFFFSWNNILVEDLKGRGFPVYKLYIAVIALFFTVILDFILIPIYGARGAAFASTVAYIVAGLVSLVIFCRKTEAKVTDMILISRKDIAVITSFYRA